VNDWLSAVTDAPAVLVTVAIVEGSGPREPGAKMLVTADGQFDTIGGGHLEMCAVDIARSMLRQAGASATSAAAATAAARALTATASVEPTAAEPAPASAAVRLERFALGPTLGQCCGGVVHLAFERVDAQLREVLSALAARRGENCWRVSAIDGVASAALYGPDGEQLAGAASPAPSLALNATGTERAGGTGSASDSAARSAGGYAGGRSGGASGVLSAAMRERGTCVVRDEAGRRWLLDACLAPRAHLLLFGAGHVGAALVRHLAELPCTVTWIDEREDMFPAEIPSNVTVEASDTPEALIAQAPQGASYLVMTHNHALDQRLSEAILARADVGWFGLIGSHTKRVQFERRMRARGVPEDRISAMVCPIGLPGIHNKSPAAIAISVCAQLLMVWEAQQAATVVQSKISQPAAVVPLPFALQRTH